MQLFITIMVCLALLGAAAFYQLWENRQKERAKYESMTPEERLDYDMAKSNAIREENKLRALSREEYVRAHGLGPTIAA